MTTKTMILGMDLGGPVLKRTAGSTASDYACAEETPGALQALRQIHRDLKVPVPVISQCTLEIEKVKRLWLLSKKFYAITGIHPRDLNFVRKPEDKVMACKRFHVTDYVEDRAEIADFALDAVQRVYVFCPDEEELKRYPRVRRQATIVHGWDELLPILLERIVRI